MHFARQMCVFVNKVAKNVMGWKCLEDGTGQFFEFDGVYTLDTHTTCVRKRP